jgi:hypothetical protein
VNTFSAPDAEQRRPVGWATYVGNQVGYFSRRMAERRPMGPNMLREWLWPVVATYDPATHRTRVGFSLIAPPGVMGDWDAIRAQMPAREGVAS